MSKEQLPEKLQAVKGMNDLLPPDSAKWGHVERTARTIFERAGYREVRTPIVEYTPLFVRSIGEATDVVEKEMYTFNDRDERSLTLRPEGTAGAARALLEWSLPVKEPVTRWFYSGPMFRHERAQKGRYRQFYQMGCEAYGIAEPTIDAEQIAMVVALFQELGIKDLQVAINSVGGPEDRPKYRALLVEYFTPLAAKLCPDCQRRLTSNPLRILDCKVEGCRRLAADAPMIRDSLSDASRLHFAGVKLALESLLGTTPFVEEPRLVRGLDYYTGTIFEIRAVGGELGSQNTLCGGGRYDRMVEEMGGPAVPAMGFAFGVERLVMTVPGDGESFEAGIDVFIAIHGDKARQWALSRAHLLRQAGLRAEIEHRVASMKSQLKRADKLRAKLVLVVGDAELDAATVQLRDMRTSEQISVPADGLVETLRARLGY